MRTTLHAAVALAVAAGLPAGAMAQMAIAPGVVTAGDTRSAPCSGTTAEREQRFAFAAGRADRVRVRYLEASDRHIFSVSGPGAPPEDLARALAYSPLTSLDAGVREGVRLGYLEFLAPDDGVYVVRALDRRTYPRSCDESGGVFELSVLIRHTPWLRIAGMRGGRLVVRAAAGPYGPITGIRIVVRGYAGRTSWRLGAARLRAGRAAIRLTMPPGITTPLRVAATSAARGPYDASEARPYLVRPT